MGLVSELNCGDFASKILLILNNRELSMKMGEKARIVAENKFALDIQESRLESIYETLFKENSIQD